MAGFRYDGGMTTEELLEAAARGDAECVRACIRSGVDLECLDEDGQTPLMLAAGSSAECVELLLGAGADAETGDKDSTTALMLACDANQAACVRLLLDAAPQTVNDRDAFGWTALMCAANQGNIETTRLLLDAGADTDYTESYVRTAAEMAEERGSRELADMLRLWATGQKAGLRIYHRSTPLPPNGGCIGTGAFLLGDCLNLPADLRHNLRYIESHAPAMLESLARRSTECGERSVYRLTQEMARQDPLHVQKEDLYLYWMRQILQALAFTLPHNAPWNGAPPAAHGFAILHPDGTLDSFTPFQLPALNHQLLHRARFAVCHAAGWQGGEKGGRMVLELGRWIP